jgi:hypothetical protein
MAVAAEKALSEAKGGKADAADPSRRKRRSWMAQPVAAIVDAVGRHQEPVSLAAEAMADQRRLVVCAQVLWLVRRQPLYRQDRRLRIQRSHRLKRVGEVVQGTVVQVVVAAEEGEDEGEDEDEQEQLPASDLAAAGLG